MRMLLLLFLSAPVVACNSGDGASDGAVRDVGGHDGGGAMCSVEPNSLLEAWTRTGEIGVRVAVVATCADPIAGNPLVGARAFDDVYEAWRVVEGECEVEDGLGYRVPSPLLVQAFTGEGFWSEADGLPHPSDDGSWGEPQRCHDPTTQSYRSPSRTLLMLYLTDDDHRVAYTAPVSDGVASGAAFDGVDELVESFGEI
jgi:hypothetical protein